MSAKTRINRPTTATPRKSETRRYLHVSTNYGWVPTDPQNPTGSARFVKIGKGETYRRPA